MKASDYLVAVSPDHETKEISVTARSESGSPHWTKTAEGRYFAEGSVSLFILMTGLDKKTAEFEKRRLIETYQNRGYTYKTLAE